jgi:hypothetical protein
VRNAHVQENLTISHAKSQNWPQKPRFSLENAQVTGPVVARFATAQRFADVDSIDMPADHVEILPFFRH